jgi:hypothetical protein
LNNIDQRPEEMREVIIQAQPGQKLRVVFADGSGPELEEKLSFVIHMMPPNGNALSLDEGENRALRVVAKSGEWNGHYEYTFTMLDGFDPHYFNRQVVNRNMLESIIVEE